MSTGGSHTIRLVAIEPNVSVGDIMKLLYGDFDILCLSSFVGSVFEDIQSRMGGSDFVPLWYSCQ